MKKTYKKFVFLYNTKAKYFISPNSDGIDNETNLTKEELLLLIQTLQFRLTHFNELEKKGRDRYKN